MLIETLQDIQDHVAIIENMYKHITENISDKYVYVCSPLRKSDKILRTFIVKAQIVFRTNAQSGKQGRYYWREVERLNYNDNTKVCASKSAGEGGQYVADKLFNNLPICIGNLWSEDTRSKFPDKFPVEFEGTKYANEKIFSTYEEAEQYINDCINGNIQCEELTFKVELYKSDEK